MASKQTRSHFLLFVGGLALLLAVLFFNSFRPDYVHFSNDGPVGHHVSKCAQLPDAFSGVWNDLNWLGANGGVFFLDITALIDWALGPVGFAKFAAPLSIFLLGPCAWFLFRRLGMTPAACVLGGLAAMLNSSFFSAACWGVSSQPIGFALDYLALGLIVASSTAKSAIRRWIFVVLTGLTVGMSVMEGIDIGAIFSVFIAAFVLYQALISEGSLGRKSVSGIVKVAVVAIFAGFLATQAVTSLVGTWVTGVSGMKQDTETKAQHWDWATQWSLPKRETVAMFVPGLFGYKMDTPKDMGELGEWFVGGNYWGAMGRDPAWYDYFASGKQGQPPSGFMRFTGGGSYLGVLVVLLALWAAFQAMRKKDSIFALQERKIIWFWVGCCVLTMLLAFGRFAPFYRLVYALPYFSTIRNPVKFLAVFNFAIIILFAYGVHGLTRRYMATAAVGASSLKARFKAWWARANSFDKRWVAGCVAALGASLIGWLVFASSRPSFEAYLQTVQFDGGTAKTIAGFSIGQVGWFILFFALGAGLVVMTLSGAFAGRAAGWGAFLLGLVLVLDLGRADLPWICYWNYKDKYATNPIIEALRVKPYEHRVAILPFRAPPQYALLDQLYRIEWAQHHFLYYDIQSLDVIQMSRAPEDLVAFESALNFDATSNTVHRVTRRWELTNTRYLLGAAGFLDALNGQMDPEKHRFRIAASFDIEPKPGVINPTRLEELTAVPKASGQYALFEFTGASPRVQLFSNWQVSTNDQTTLQRLGSKDFDPSQTVLVADQLPVAAAQDSKSQAAGRVEFASYAPKDIVLKAEAPKASVLLLNDKYDPNWQVTVDGKPEKLLRCNYLMRGVYLTDGIHTVEFQFKQPLGPRFVTLSAICLSALLLVVLAFTGSVQPQRVAPVAAPLPALQRSR